MGIMELLRQYFKNGFELVAKKRNRLLCKMNVVIFQFIINIPIAMPVMAAPPAFTFPRYSGARNNPLAPNIFMKFPVMVKNNMNQKIRST